MDKKDDLALYRDACKRWLEWLDGDELHSINGAISRLLWNDAVFRVFNEARHLANKDAGAAAISPVLAAFLDQGYVSEMILGITKLTEFSDPKHPKKGVISLRRLVDELIANRQLLTRRAYVTCDGHPYDYARLREAQIRPLLEAGTPDGVFIRGGGEPAKDWMAAERFHGQFDRLASVSPDRRTPDDLVSEALLERLSDALKDAVFDKIRAVRHKIAAHAADAYSRGEATAPKGISFDDADKALKTLLGVRQIIQASILNNSWRAGAIPVPQYDQFQHLDKPFVAARDMKALQDFWDQHTKERDDWLHGAWSDLMK